MINVPFMMQQPKIAILDDDIEFRQDVANCLKGQSTCLDFSSPHEIKQAVQSNYQLFIDELSSLYKMLANEEKDEVLLCKTFMNIQQQKPISVALVDLNLGNDDQYEGLKVCEELTRFNAFPIAYTGLDLEELAMELCNQKVIAGYLNKEKDFFDNVVPAIMANNSYFYSMHYNLTHSFTHYKSPVIASFNYNNLPLDYLLYDDKIIVIQDNQPQILKVRELEWI